MKKTLFYTQAIAMSVALVFSQSASASITPTPWVGTATYGTTTPLFDTYSFGSGVALIDLNATDGTFTGKFQTYVEAHQLNGSGVSVANLISTGASVPAGVNDFELTMVATFSGTRTSAADASTFEYAFNPGGSASLYYDVNPNFSFINDYGFNDGLEILSGTVQSGEGAILSFGLGIQDLDLSVFSSPIGFTPSTINGGTVTMSLSEITGNTSTINSILAVGSTHTVGGIGVTSPSIKLIQTAGTLTLTAVPIPPAFLLFFSAAITLVATRKRCAT